jgi:hypothetical protein
VTRAVDTVGELTPGTGCYRIRVLRHEDVMMTNFTNQEFHTGLLSNGPIARASNDVLCLSNSGASSFEARAIFVYQGGQA